MNSKLPCIWSRKINILVQLFSEINQSINQSINQASKQASKHCNQSINQSINRSVFIEQDLAQCWQQSYVCWTTSIYQLLTVFIYLFFIFLDNSFLSLLKLLLLIPFIMKLDFFQNSLACMGYQPTHFTRSCKLPCQDIIRILQDHARILY